MAKRRLITQFIADAKEVHGDLYDYSEFIYATIHTKGVVRCPVHGPFSQRPSAHLRGAGCPSCGRGRTIESKRSNKERFVREAIRIHSGLYNYDDFNYVNSSTKGVIFCALHGDFLQHPNGHLRGRGCPSCATEQRSQARRVTLDEFIGKAQAVHGTRYDYSLFEYVDAKTKGMVICLSHGVFQQAPTVHLAGHGCRVCANVRISEARSSTRDRFVAAARERHGERYKYDRFEYIDATTKGVIVCPRHGPFVQLPSNHLSGVGCPSCGHIISHAEKSWLDLLRVPLRQHRLKLNTGVKKVDGYDPSTNTVYEYHGSFWHGNPEVYSPDCINVVTQTSMAELYENTLASDRLIIESGYHLVSKWGR